MPISALTTITVTTVDMRGGLERGQLPYPSISPHTHPTNCNVSRKALATLLWECGPFYWLKSLGCCSFRADSKVLLHHSEGGEEEWSPVSQVCLFNDARRGAVATCPWEAEGSILKHLGLWASDQNFRVSYKETFTAAPRKLLPGGRFLPRLFVFTFLNLISHI